MRIQKMYGKMIRRAAAGFMAICLAFPLAGSFDGNSVKEVQAAVRGYSTENVIPAYEGQPEKLKPADGKHARVYADDWAEEYVKKNHCEDYLPWLTDYIINIAEPQAVNMVLRIPCLREAVDQGLISKYIGLDMTYNDVNQFGAMTLCCYLGKKGNMVKIGSEPICTLAHHLTVNLMNFDQNTRNDVNKRRELQDTLVHEMLHAFMNDYTRNAMVGLHKDGSWNKDENNMLPLWFVEGTAVSLQAVYDQRRDEILQLLLLDPDAGKEEILAELSDADSIFYNLAYMRDQILEQESPEEYAEEYGSRDALMTSLPAEENTYNLSYLGVMNLYNMAAVSMGLDTFDDEGRVQMDALLQGLDMILRLLHNGSSMDEIIAWISTDPYTGVPEYTDTADYERKFMQSADDSGSTFALLLLQDFESRIGDPADYVPSGSVLPGYNTSRKDFMDENYHAAPPAFEIIIPDDPYYDREQSYYAVSTVPNSLTALGGGRRISYSEAPELTDAEEAAMSVLDTGGLPALIDEYKGQEYKSTNDWIWVANP